MLNALATIATSVGLSSALILFFVWQAWKREERLTTRIENLEDFSRTKLIELARETTSALLKDAEATSACTQAINSNTAVMAQSVETAKRVEGMMTQQYTLTKELAAEVKEQRGS